MLDPSVPSSSEAGEEQITQLAGAFAQAGRIGEQGGGVEKWLDGLNRCHGHGVSGFPSEQRGDKVPIMVIQKLPGVQ